MNKRLFSILMAAAAAVSCGYLGRSPAADDGAGTSPVAASTLDRNEARSITEFAAEIPDAEVADLDLEMALTLVTMPLSCFDRPHAQPRDRSTYLDEIASARRPGFERDRAFYGCWDWHSAVNSTWAVIKIHKEFPDIPVSGLIREKLGDHLSISALAGEAEFFDQSRTFERPYGWAWLLYLYAELRTWDDESAQAWADNMAPLAQTFSERMVTYLESLERPSRSGTHSNTAFALAVMLDYTRTVEDTTLEEAIVTASSRLFGSDVQCPTAYEPWASDFLSPCLEEAALMADVLEPAAFIAWFDAFMPPVNSPSFLPLTTPVYTAEGASVGDETDQADGEETPVSVEEDAATTMETEATGATDDPEAGGDAESAAEADDADEQRQVDETIRRLGARSHLIGLAFIRADAMNRIAAALPPDDARVAAYRKLAAYHGEIGFEAMFDADYAGSHWIGTFALKYLLSARD